MCNCGACRYRQELEISIQEAKVEALKLAERQARNNATVINGGDDVTAAAASDDDDDVDLDSVEALAQK